MSTIRPLATITILAAMGIFLYLKINEGSSSAPAPMPAEWEEAPKFEFGSPSTSSAPAPGSSAPAFAPPAAAPSFESAAPAPKFESAAPAPAPSFESAPPLESAPPEATSSTNTAPPLPDLPPVSTAPVESTSPSDAANDVASVAEPAAMATTEAAPGLPPIPELPPLPTATSEMPGPIAPAPPELTEPTTPAAATTPIASPFATARPAIDAALSQGELARAHLLLSDWYNDPALSPTEKEEVQTLLNQLAGTVIYSNEHRLEPAYTVQTGETLETIAEKHRVPWQLLAKINGVATATGVQPGQTVKVVRGPFMGVVDVSDSELTLTIDGRYAGKFPVQLDGAATAESEWTVEQKQLEPATGPTATDRRLVLRNDEQTSATVLITTGSSPSTGGTPPLGTIRIAQQQAEDLYDILSVGSRVVIRR